MRVEFNNQKFADLLKAARLGQLQMWFLGNISTTTEGFGFLALLYGGHAGFSNLARFRLPEFDKLYEQARAMPDGAARTKILQRMSTSGRPVIVGPWLSEVGFELLYWIPFLNWVKTYRPFDPERLYVVSRGGAGVWYQNITTNYIDLFEFYTPEQFRAKNTERQQENKQKHLALTDFDREILKVVYQQVGSKECDLLHPMYMYQLFYAYWKSRMSVNVVDQFASFEPTFDRMVDSFRFS